jgi:hypothetical protein
MKQRILLAGIFIVIIALFPNLLLADTGSVYITSDTECEEPIDLQDNTPSPINAWLKLPSGVEVADLCWELFNKSEFVASGVFTFVCTTSDDKYTLATTGLTSLAVGSYTSKVDYGATGDTFSGDSFRIE